MTKNGQKLVKNWPKTVKNSVKKVPSKLTDWNFVRVRGEGPPSLGVSSQVPRPRWTLVSDPTILAHRLYGVSDPIKKNNNNKIIGR